MANLIPQDIREWMRRMEFKTNDLTRRMSNLIPGDIADGVDLNGYRSSGRWRRPSTVGTTTAQNYPFNGASGTLEVYQEPSNAQVQQIWYDRTGGVWSRWWNGAVWSSWFSTGTGGLPLPVSATVAAAQLVTSAGNAALPTPVSASLSLPAGSFLVQASVSALIGGGTTFNPTGSGAVKYGLTGAITFTPGTNTQGVAGVDRPIGAGGGTLSQVHQVNVPSGGTLTINALGVAHVGSVNVRDVTVQLVVLRRA